MVNKLSLMLFAVPLLSVAAFANTTPSANCTPFPVTFTNGAGGPSPVSCPAFSVPGGTLTGVALTYAADYQFGSDPGPNTIQVTFVAAAPGGVTWSPMSQTLTDTGGSSSGPRPTGGANATAGISAAAFSSPFMARSIFLRYSLAITSRLGRAMRIGPPGFKYLNLGCGQKYVKSPEWLNADMLPVGNDAVREGKLPRGGRLVCACESE